ncbi:hypothetical protein F2Q69_00060805 [Brassica cretica]|uniref:Uncharacterized protein n=1 Tax=Brassica cretica TaxID=69181 RepID=A0A8S9RMX2_BRACR|nr:hypothetical protein F2Q69_00060805 [Brassica cretica]
MNFTKNRKGKSEICGSKENRVEKNESHELTCSDTMKECEDKEIDSSLSSLGQKNSYPPRKLHVSTKKVSGLEEAIRIRRYY